MLRRWFLLAPAFVTACAAAAPAFAPPAPPAAANVPGDAHPGPGDAAAGIGGSGGGARGDAGAPLDPRARREMLLFGPAPIVDAGDAAVDGGLARGPGDIVIAPIPADPTPLRERAQWVFDLRWEKGDAYLVGVQREELSAPQETPRAMGRFALELYEGPALIERVRFDFPLLGAGAPPDAGMRTLPSFESKLTSRIGVVFPATRKGTRLELWDRATDRRWPLPWPPRP